jgi:hypothetical protein
MPDEYEYVSQPPEFENLVKSQSQDFFPPNADIAWMMKLIETKLDDTSLPEDIKKSMATDMSIYITTAGMTNITKGQVMEFVNGFKEVWYRYVIFKIKKKYRPELYYAFGLLRELLIMNLNKSVTGWQGDHVFEKRTTYDILQKRKDITDKVKGFFFKKKVKTTEREEVES